MAYGERERKRVEGQVPPLPEGHDLVCFFFFLKKVHNKNNVWKV
jgi:hypothetical protein